MARPTVPQEMDAIAREYYLMDNGKAFDLVTSQSYLADFILKQRKGYFELIEGGKYATIPIKYAHAWGTFFARGEAVTINHTETVRNVYAEMKRSLGQGVVLKADTDAANGDYGIISLIQKGAADALEKAGLQYADNLFAEYSAVSTVFTGIGACCDATATRAFQQYSQNDIISDKGTYPWTGRRTTATVAISANQIRAQVARAHQTNQLEPNLYIFALDKWYALVAQLDQQQRFTPSEKIQKAGFKKGLVLDGSIDVYPDDYIPATWGLALCAECFGWAGYKNGFFRKGKWTRIPNAADDDMYMNVYLVGNNVVVNRAVHDLQVGLMV